VLPGRDRRRGADPHHRQARSTKEKEDREMYLGHQWRIILYVAGPTVAIIMYEPESEGMLRNYLYRNYVREKRGNPSFAGVGRVQRRSDRRPLEGNGPELDVQGAEIRKFLSKPRG